MIVRMMFRSSLKYGFAISLKTKEIVMSRMVHQCTTYEPEVGSKEFKGFQNNCVMLNHV